MEGALPTGARCARGGGRSTHSDLRKPPPSNPSIGVSSEFPTLEEVADAIRGRESVLPVPLLPHPGGLSKKSGRGPQRAAKLQAVCRAGNEVLKGVNATYAGDMQQQAGERA